MTEAGEGIKLLFFDTFSHENTEVSIHFALPARILIPHSI